MCLPLPGPGGGGQSSHRGAFSTLGSLETEQGSAYDHSRPSLAPASVQTDLTACRWKGCQLQQRTPEADTGSTKTALLDTLSSAWLEAALGHGHITSA